MRIARIKSPVTVTLLGLVAGLAGLTITRCFAESDNLANTPSITTGEGQPGFSSGVRDVLKMVDAKVDVDVVKTYIKNSAVAYNPTASEIIILKQRGVPDDIIAALIEHGGEMRAQLARTGTVPQSQAPVTAPTTPEYGYGNEYGASMAYPSTYPAYADYAYGYPYSAYYGYPYYGYYGYPYSYWYSSWYYPWGYYGYYYPYHWAYWNNHHHGDHGHDGHWHDGHSVAVHGHNGSSGHGAPWAPVSRGTGHGSWAGNNGSAARPTVASIGARSGGFSPRSTAFAGARSMGGGARPMAVNSGGFAGRSMGAGPAMRSGGFAVRSSGGFGGGARGGGGGGGARGGGFGGGGHGGGHR